MAKYKTTRRKKNPWLVYPLKAWYNTPAAYGIGALTGALAGILGASTSGVIRRNPFWAIGPILGGTIAGALATPASLKALHQSIGMLLGRPIYKARGNRVPFSTVMATEAADFLGPVRFFTPFGYFRSGWTPLAEKKAELMMKLAQRRDEIPSFGAAMRSPLFPMVAGIGTLGGAGLGYLLGRSIGRSRRGTIIGALTGLGLSPLLLSSKLAHARALALSRGRLPVTTEKPPSFGRSFGVLGKGLVGEVFSPLVVPIGMLRTPFPTYTK